MPCVVAASNTSLTPTVGSGACGVPARPSTANRSATWSVTPATRRASAGLADDPVNGRLPWLRCQMSSPTRTSVAWVSPSASMDRDTTLGPSTKVRAPASKASSASMASRTLAYAYANIASWLPELAANRAAVVGPVAIGEGPDTQHRQVVRGACAVEIDQLDGFDRVGGHRPGGTQVRRQSIEDGPARDLRLCSGRRDVHLQPLRGRLAVEPDQAPGTHRYRTGRCPRQGMRRSGPPRRTGCRPRGSVDSPASHHRAGCSG